MALWSRRTFLKAGALSAAGTALEARGTLLSPGEKAWNAGSGRSLRKFRDPVPTVCRVCPSGCALTAYRDGDRVVQLLGGRGALLSRGLCARAYTALERLYDAERVLTPMRRRGPRGAEAWEPISWEAALAELKSRLGKGARGKVLHLGSEELGVEELRAALGLTEILVDGPAAGRSGPASAAALYGAPALRPDVLGAATILLLGAPALDGRFDLPLAEDLLTALGSGARAHLIAPLQGVTGSLCAWTPISPGAEAEFGFGLARALLFSGRYDPAVLKGSVTESPEALLEALAAYTPERVESACGLPKGELDHRAGELLEGRPSLVWAPLGSAAAVPAALLNHLLGAVDAPGGVPTAREPAFVTPTRTLRSSEAFLRGLADGTEAADLYWVVDANPAYDAPESPRVARALADPERVGFLVATDTHLTETARLADLFLPWATPLESWGLLEGNLPDGRTYLLLQQPVTLAPEPANLRAAGSEQRFLFERRPAPLGQARSLPDVLLALAGGGPRSLGLLPDAEAWLRGLLRRSRGPGSLEALRVRGAWLSEDPPAREARLPVALGKLIPPVRASDAPPASLRLVGYSEASLPGHPVTRWGREAAHPWAALLHPETAALHGISAGDAVHLRTPWGEARARVRVIRGIHPGAVALPDGLGHRKSARSSDAGWWEDEPTSSLRALFPFRIGPLGVQQWEPVPVEIRKT